MAGSEELRFDIVGNGSGASDAFTEVAATADLAAKGARRLQMALEAERRAVDVNAQATLSLAAADKILEEVEREESGEAQKSRDAQLEDAAAKRANADASKRSASEQESAAKRLNSLFGGMGILGKVATVGTLALGPQALGIAAGVAGLGVAFGAAAAGATVFGLVAKSELTKVEAAQKALATAQASYATATTAAGRATALKAETAALAGLSPAEVQLAKDLTMLTGAWSALGQAEAPVIASSIAPWIQTATGVLQYFRPLVKDTGDALQFLGTEARGELAAPFWGQFFNTLGHTGEISLIGFGEALGKVGDGFAHLFVTFAPDIDKLPGLINKWAGSFDTWASAYNRSGFDNFMNNTFSATNTARLKTDLQDAGTILGNVAKATGQISPAAFLGLSNVLSLLAKLSPGQIEAIAVLYSAAKLGGTVSGSKSPLAVLGLPGLGKKTVKTTTATSEGGGGTPGAIPMPGLVGTALAISGEMIVNIGISAAKTSAQLGTAGQAMGQFNYAIKTFQDDSAAGQSARAQLIRDLQGFGLPAATASSDLTNLANAVKQNGYYSTAANGARQKLITDLENTGMNAEAATRLVDTLGTAIGQVPKSETTTFNFLLGSVSSGLSTYLNKEGAGSATVVTGGGGVAQIRLATGGVLTEPVYGVGSRSGKSYLLGESGREAVIPLSGAGSVPAVSSGVGGGGSVQVVFSGSGAAQMQQFVQMIWPDLQVEVRTRGGGGPNSAQRALGQTA